MAIFLPGCADLVANLVESAWLTRYPLPSKVIVDRSREFFKEFKTIICDNYNIKVRPITTCNTQTNAILECMHQAIGYIISTFNIQRMILDENNPGVGIPTATM